MLASFKIWEHGVLVHETLALSNRDEENALNHDALPHDGLDQQYGELVTPTISILLASFLLPPWLQQ